MISKKMQLAVQAGSMVRKMFEQGRELKAQYGKDNVYDFSLGNPDLNPPKIFFEGLEGVVKDKFSGAHSYMENAGYFNVRKELAQFLNKTIGKNLTKPIEPELLILTVGAAGALNVALKSLIDPGDKVAVLAPFFMEYAYYIDNHAGKIKVIDTDKSFLPDLNKIDEELTSETKALIINSPNNPTGIVYNKEIIKNIGKILKEKSQKKGEPIYLISDEPYYGIVFNGISVPSIFEFYEYSIIVNSFSKDLSIPGERIGYLLINPMMADREKLAEAAILANRILGFVNAPAMMQRILAFIFKFSSSNDYRLIQEEYQARVNLMRNILLERGYQVPQSQGTFYLFPKSPIKDDIKFIEILKKYLILAVPGTGFMRSEYFRLSLCLDQSKIAKSSLGFEKALLESQNY